MCQTQKTRSGDALAAVHMGKMPNKNKQVGLRDFQGPFKHMCICPALFSFLAVMSNYVIENNEKNESNSFFVWAHTIKADSENVPMLHRKKSSFIIIVLYSVVQIIFLLQPTNNYLINVFAINYTEDNIPNVPLPKFR